MEHAPNRHTAASKRNTLGRYELVAELARGGMGIVYLATAQGLGGFRKLLVVKELRADLLEEPMFLEMFIEEARVAARLNHPNIVQTNEVGSDGDRYFIAMEYLDGRSLQGVRRRAHARGVPFSTIMGVRVLSDALLGLEYAHTLADFDRTPLGIVHRDVSPQNIILTFDGQVKVVDFGIAKAADSVHETRVGMLKGKIAYMAPEQARNERVDARADVFSVGVLLWETIVGARLWTGCNDFEIMRRLSAGEFPRPSTVVPGVPPILDAMCARAMAYDPADRYASAASFRDDLESYLASVDSAPTLRDIGALVTGLFGEERAKTHRVIETHLTRPGGEMRDALPTMDDALQGQHSGPGASVDISMAPVPPPAPSGVRATVAGGREQRAIPGKARTLGWASLVPAAALGVGGALVTIVLMMRAGRATEANDDAAVRPVVTAVVAAPPAAPPSSAPAQDLADIEIRVSPEQATIAVDGVTVAGNPFRGRYSIGSGIHRVRATAPGYIARVEDVAFKSSMTVELVLDRIPQGHVFVPVPAHPPVAARPPAPPPVRQDRQDPPASPDVPPQGGTKPRRAIDVSSPYGVE